MADLLVRAARAIDDAAARALARACGVRGAARHGTSLRFDGVDADAARRATVRAICDDAALDAAWLPRAASGGPRSWRDHDLIVFDMDSTLIDIECIDELAACVGRGVEVAALTEAAMRSPRIDYDASLRARVALLAGLPVEALPEVYARRVRFNPGARALVAHARAEGLHVALVSGGFDYFTGRVQAELGIDTVVCNRLGVAHGHLTGTLEGPLINAAAKAATLRALCARLGTTPDRAIAVGDGANDLGMMQAAGLAVGFRCKPVLREHVHVDIRALGLDSLVGALSPER